MESGLFHLRNSAGEGLDISQVFCSPWTNYFTPGFVCGQHTAPGNIKLAQTPLSQGTNSYLGRVDPRRFISCAQRNSLSANV